MAKVTITFEDGEHWNVNLQVDFDPPVTKETEFGTPAQNIAAELLERMKDIIEPQTGGEA